MNGGAKWRSAWYLIVRPAQELEVRDRRVPAFGERDHMVELEKPAFRATAVAPGKGTPAFIALPHFTSHRRRDMTGSGH